MFHGGGNEWSLLTIAVVLGGVIGLSMLKRAILPVLMGLLQQCLTPGL